MYDQFLTLAARERADAVEREAEVFRLMVESAPLTFRRRSVLEDGRRALARGLVKLAKAIEPARRSSANC
jgi:hypothetical protein